MSGNDTRATELPAEMLDDERSWHGDHDPYLGGLAHEGRKHREPPAARGPRLSGPIDDGDLYLAQLKRKALSGHDKG